MDFVTLSQVLQRLLKPLASRFVIVQINQHEENRNHRVCLQRAGYKHWLNPC